MRVPAMQAWPLFAKPASSARGIALAKSASSRITVGDLPPSSRVTRFNVSAPPRRIALPTAVEPVKERFEHDLSLSRAHFARLYDCSATSGERVGKLAADESGITVPRCDKSHHPY